MDFNTLNNYFVDVTDQAVHSYVGFIQNDYINEPANTNIDSLVVYNLLKQNNPTDEIDDANSDVEEFGLIDKEDLIALVKSTFNDNFHIYEVNDAFVRQLDAYNQKFGLDYRNHLNWFTKQSRLNDPEPAYQHEHLYVVADNKTEPSFKASLNQNVFGGLTNNTKAIDLFLQQN